MHRWGISIVSRVEIILLATVDSYPAVRVAVMCRGMVRSPVKARLR